MGAVERAQDLMNELQLQFSMVIRTGAIPHSRAHVFVKIDGGEADGERLRQINIALEKQFGGDHVANPSRVLRLAGTISYPNRAKRERGYSTELVTLRAAEQPFSYAPEQLFAALRLSEPDKLVPQHISRVLKLRRTDDDLERLLQASCVPGQWHNSIRDAVASMIGRGWEDAAIRLSCAEYCTGGASDPDLDLLINGGRRKWDKPNIEGAAERDFCSMADLNRLNKDARGAADRRQDPRRDIRRTGGISRPRNHRDDPDNRRLQVAQKQVPPHLAGRERRTAKPSLGHLLDRTVRSAGSTTAAWHSCRSTMAMSATG